jgi:hypothetical protein
VLNVQYVHLLLLYIKITKKRNSALPNDVMLSRLWKWCIAINCEILHRHIMIPWVINHLQTALPVLYYLYQMIGTKKT